MFRILIADDWPDEADIAARLIAHCLSCEIDVAYDGAAALQRAQAVRPDVLILDLHMPLLGGLEVATLIRRHYASDPPYLIAFTGRPDAVADLRAIDQVFDRAFAKPLDMDPLLATLQCLADGRLLPRPALPADGQALRNADGAPHPGPGVPPVPGHGAQRHHDVLLVDDHELNRAVGRALLEALGYAVRTAHDGLDAIDQCRQAPPQAVLMDLNMPVLGGLEATIRLRELQREGSVALFPIVAATADASPEAEAACRGAGMDGFIAKPLDLRMLRDELRRVMRPV